MSALASVDSMFPEIMPPGEWFRQLNVNIYMVLLNGFFLYSY